MNKSLKLIETLESLTIKSISTIIVPKETNDRFDSHGKIVKLLDKHKNVIKFTTPKDAIDYLKNLRDKDNFVVVWEDKPIGTQWDYKGNSK